MSKWGFWLLAFALCAVLAPVVSAQSPTSTVSPTASSAPAATSAPAADSDDEGGGGGIFSWWGNFRLQGLMKTYDIDQATAEKLAEIVRAEKLREKELQAEANVIVARIEIALSENKPVEEVVSLLDQLRAKKSELGNVESETLVKIQELMGPQKTAKYVLAQRGMFQRAGSAVRRAREQREEQPAETTPRRRGGPTGY